MRKKMSIGSIKSAKGSKKLVMITAYDALFAKLFEDADMILVGDSLNMSFAGKSDTLSATLDQMIYHTNAVAMGAKESFIICDMPFGTYTNKDDALQNAIKVFQQSSADAIKIEGGSSKAEIVRHLCENGIAVCGHIGLLPQAFRSEGGYKIKGKSDEEEQRLIADARSIAEAGAFCIVIEGVKADVASRVAKSVSVPLVGIGSGSEVDGQVLVWSDAFGLFSEFKPKFVRTYLDGASIFKDAMQHYIDDVRSGAFPSKDESY
ncbi:MAG: 3-methyl-2-oxobutanoate hydroxymethyltransferase [Sulfuricurvum sp.]